MSLFSQDGACIPSWLGVVDPHTQGQMAGALVSGNLALKVGFVVGIHYPPEPGTGTDTRYDIACRASVGMEASTWQLYTNCRLSAGLGGTEAEYTRARLRAPRKAYDHKIGVTPETVTESTAVILQCEHGFTQYGIIIGFAEHPNIAVDDIALGYHWEWRRNGIYSSINKDGEYSVQFTGTILDPNTNTYIAAPAATTGTFFKFLKDGSWAVDDVKGESITLDKTNQQISILARGMSTTVTNESYSVSSAKKVDFQAGSTAVFNGSKIYVGKEGASNPLVLGNELAGALKELVNTFLNVPIIGRAGSIPVWLDPQLRAKLVAWNTVYGRKKNSPFLSRKGFVE